MLLIQYSSCSVLNTLTSVNGQLDHSEEPILKVYAVEHPVRLALMLADRSCAARVRRKELDRKQFVLGRLLETHNAFVVLET